MDIHKWSCSALYNFILLITLGLLLSACDLDSTAVEYDLEDTASSSHIEEALAAGKNKNVYYFGFDLRASPQEDARQYLPFLTYLEESTGYKFKLHFTSKKHNIIDDLGMDEIQFAAIGAESFIRAQQKYKVIPLVRGLNEQNKAEYQSVFVVAPKSKIKRLDDIKGQRLAFGSRNSTQGHLIPRIVLEQEGLQLESFASYTYTGSHLNCANAVLAANVDVCAMQDTMAKNMVRQGLLRIIYTSSYYPSSGVAVNNTVAKEVQQKVRMALVDFKPQGKDKTGLYHWNRTEMPRGFKLAQAKDYDELSKWSSRLGFLK